MNKGIHKRIINPKLQMARQNAGLAMKSKGFSLLEVLIALIVLSIGSLGLATLQMIGLKNIHESNQRSQAVLLAHEMTDRIRANPAPSPPDPPNSIYNMATGAAVGSVCVGSCGTAARVASDLKEWSDATAARLPAGKAYVCIDSTPATGDTFASPNCDGTGTVYSIKIWWDYNRDGTADEPLLVSFQP